MGNNNRVLGTTKDPSLYTSKSWNKTSGETQVYRQLFTGGTDDTVDAAHTSAEAAYASIKASGIYDTCNIEATNDGATWLVTGSVADDHETVVIEQIPVDSSQDSIRSPVLQSKLSEDTISAILQAIRDFENNVGSDDPVVNRDALTTWITAIKADSSDLDADIDTFFEDRMLGLDSYFNTDGVTIRKTTTSRIGQYATIDDTNVGKIYTTSQLRNELGLPNVYYMPTGYWFKKRPGNLIQFGQRQQWVQEYVFSTSQGTLYYTAAT